MTMLLNREDISCTSILVGSGPHLHCAFGYTPDTEILRHLSTSTCGAYIERSFLPSGCALQELLLLKFFSPNPSTEAPVHPYVSTLVMDGEAVVSDMTALHAMMAVDYPFPWVGPPPMVPLLQTQHKAYPLECDLPRIVDVRVREGFVVTAASADDNLGKDRILSIRLILSWLPNIKVAYTVQVSIGPKGPNSVLKIELTVLAYYEFLHQFMKNERGAQSPAALSVTKLQHFLANIHETDLVLSYLYCQCQSSSAPPGTPSPPTAPQNLQAQYKAFWKTMNGLRNHSWHRWLKTEKIGILLSPMITILDAGIDSFVIPLHSCLSTPQLEAYSCVDHVSVGQFPLPRPRAVYPAHFLYDPPTAILLDYCTRWATFHQSKQLFVKFLDPPLGVSSALLPSPSFCVVRLSFETSGFVIMQLAFFSTHPVARAEAIANLKQDLSNLAYPSTADEREVVGANPVSAQRALVVGPPVTPISRSIRTMLVRYDPVTVHSAPHGPPQAQPLHNPARLVFNHSATPLPSFSPLLAWYMWRHRWVWTLPDTSIVEQMLGILIESRLKEGFTLVNVAHGIYTFVKEFVLHTPKSSVHPRVQLPCTLQYVTFVASPHTLTTELWMEPQQGRCVHQRGESTEAELFSDLRVWFEGIDTKVISALSTLYLLDSADIRDRKLDLSNYPRNAGPYATSQLPSVYYLVHPSSAAFPPRRLDVLSQFAVEKFERLYPLLTHAAFPDADHSKPTGAQASTNGISSSDTSDHHVSNAGVNSTALLDAVNDKLYMMIADCMVWLSDYEVIPDKSLPEDSFTRGRTFVKIIRTHPRTPPRTSYASPLLATRLVLVHLKAQRNHSGIMRNHLEVSFYIMSADSFRCPSPPNSAAAERVSFLFTPGDVQIISSEQDGEEEEEDTTDEREEKEASQVQEDENYVAHAAVTSYLSQISEAYKRCFAKAVYTHLRSQAAVSSQDFSSCLDVLHSAHLDIDLSEFLGVISAAQPFYTANRDIQDQFSTEMAYHFARVPLPNSPYFFYHQPPTVANYYEYEDEDDSYGYDKKADVEYDYPQPNTRVTESLELCPPFIGETEGDMDSKDALGIYALPLLLRMEVIRGEAITDVVTTIPTSPMGPTTLRFVCLALPPLLGPGKLLHESICTILHKHKQRIVCLLSAKILDSLRVVHPLSDSMLETVTHHLASLSHTSPKNKMRSRHVQGNTFELTFVDRREGNIRYPQELKNNKPSDVTSAENPAIVHLSRDLYTLVTLPNSSVSGDHPQDDSQSYWLLLICKPDSVVASLFVSQIMKSPQETNLTEPTNEPYAETLWRGIRHGIRAVARRVNQLILLEHLHENRVCAELLLPSEAPSPQQALRTSSGKEEKVDTKGRGNFRPGEFECPLVHTITLPLHERATLSHARSLLLTALHPFEVANHSNLFVYHQENGRIFYICLRTAAAIQPPTASVLEQPRQISPPPSPSLPVHGLSQAAIVLNVYGVDLAGPEITQHLHQHLENKLSTNTLNSLSDLFMRNPLLKLTTEDLDFLRSAPSLHSPTLPKVPHTLAIQIPLFVTEPYTYLLFLKQNLMQFLQTIHLSQAAQLREDAEISVEPNPTERFFIRPSEFLLMYNHISSPTSAPPFSTIGSGMACVSLALLDAMGSCMASTTRSSVHASTDWTLEELRVTQLPDVPQRSNPPHADSMWSHMVLIRIWNRLPPLNTLALVNHLILCANQTVCEYVLETSLLYPLSAPLDALPVYMHNIEGVLSRAKTLVAPSVYKNTFTMPLSAWASHSFLAELRDIITDCNSTLGLQVFTCSRDANGALHCAPSQHVGTRPGTEGGPSPRCTCEDVECAYAAATADFYQYSDELGADCDSDSTADLDFASAMLAQCRAESSYVIWGGKKVDPVLKTDQHLPSLLYPPIKNSQLAEPIIRQCHVSVRIDMPLEYEQGCKMTVHTYNWDQTKLETLKDRCIRLVSLYTLKQHIVTTVTHHKMGLFHHQPSLPSTNTQPLGTAKLTWETTEAVIAPQPHTKRRTTIPTQDATEKSKEDKDQDSEVDYKKAQHDSHRHVRPAVEFDCVFKDHYHPTPYSTLVSQTKDPVAQLTYQSKALAVYIEQRAALCTAAMGSISILPNPSSGTVPSPLTSFQLDSVINVARLVHFRCVPFLFGDQILEYGPAHSTQALPILDAFVRDYIDYLSGLGVCSLLVDKGSSSASTKRVSTRAYLQKVFLDGCLLVKISFREGSVACELFAVPQFNVAAQTPQFSSHHARHFGEEFTRFTRILHLNSFTYDFHVNQLYRMIQFPSIPAPYLPPTQSLCSILQALHQYYPTPPVHASTCLDSFTSACPTAHLSPELPETTTKQILEFMMLDETCVANSIVPLHHFGIRPAILLRAPSSVPYSELCAVVFAREALPELDEECGCGNDKEPEVLPQPEAPDSKDENIRHLLLHVFVVKVGELCITEPSQHLHNPHQSDNFPIVEKLHKATATSSINYQRNQLWYKLQHGNPYSPALTHSEFQLLTQLAFSRQATTLDPTLIHPVNLLKLGSGVWHQLLTQLRAVSGERVRQVFADPIHHLLIFHPSNNSQLVHFVWDEAEKEANILLCRLDRSSIGIPACDYDEASHLSRLITFVCHFIWKLLLVKQPV